MLQFQQNKTQKEPNNLKTLVEFLGIRHAYSAFCCFPEH